jgi:hypothetical protein
VGEGGHEVLPRVQVHDGPGKERGNLRSAHICEIVGVAISFGIFRPRC